MMKEPFTRYIKEFKDSLKFDIQQSANLYFLPLRKIVSIYRDGVEQVQHRPAKAVSEVYQAAMPSSQRTGETTLKGLSSIAVGQKIGPSAKNVEPPRDVHVSSLGIRSPLGEPGSVLSALRPTEQSAGSGAFA